MQPMTMQAIQRDDDFREWRILIHIDAINALRDDLGFLDYVNRLRQTTTSDVLRGLYTLLSIAQFAESAGLAVTEKATPPPDLTNPRG